jgi:hypothetical protein
MTVDNIEYDIVRQRLYIENYRRYIQSIQYHIVDQPSLDRIHIEMLHRFDQYTILNDLNKVMHRM